MLSVTTLLLQLQPAQERQRGEEKSLMLGLLLDLLSREALRGESDPLFYTEVIGAEDEDLRAAVMEAQGA